MEKLKLIALLGSCILLSGLSGCSVAPNPAAQLSLANQPLIDAELESAQIPPFPRDRIRQKTLQAMGSVEGHFRDEFWKFLKTPGIFDYSNSNKMKVRADLLSWQDLAASPLQSEMETVVKYTFEADDGAVLLEKTIKTTSSESSVWLVGGIYRNIRAAQKSFSENIAQLAMVMKKELPGKWQAHLNDKYTIPAIVEGGNSSRRPKAPASQNASISANGLPLGEYHALVVGNNSYQSLPRLKTALNDARSMAGLLEKTYRFKVKLLENATRADILKSLVNYRYQLTERDNLLIFYAGHGWLDNEADEGYWLPVDAEPNDPTNWISNGALANSLKAMKAKHVLVVADSCYAGKLARGVKMVLKGRNYFQTIASRKSRTVLASGGLEPVADAGGRGNHSVFSSELINALKGNKGLIDATDLFNQIRRPVVLNSDQAPEYSDIRKAGHDGGDFIFARR